ncbi:leukotriene A-4 hydrolase-like isoform X2 [Temnothorax nylanderi]|uniref:leukotriene A-4 hydrolase-like isoform X2 n=1 Tax=Temnothorax nylanderi TaxID=102681 RepID=UPI003A8BAD8C
MDFSSSTKHPHSFALPELARVIHTDLELMVDFDQKVLEGKAILTITRQPSINQIILDNLGLVISSVTLDGRDLHYHIGFNFAAGSAIYVDLPLIIGTDNPDCKIEIEYKTTPQSDALYWLTPAQTVYDSHPFLLSNNKIIYARSWFPCQDTPSVKFTYSAMIWVQKPYTVLMSALSKGIHEGPELNVHVFRQEIPVPSYAVVIAVGSLHKQYFNDTINMFAEENTLRSYATKIRYSAIEDMLQYANINLCGPYKWGRYDICVLPPSIAHFEIECPCVTFISSTLLGGDRSYVSYSLARNISQSWAGNFVTCENYQHLWLNKSLSIFISRKIQRSVLYHEDIDVFLQREEVKNLNKLVREPANYALLRCLLPNFNSPVLPHIITKYVPYERGYFLLCHLENILGGPTVFNPFLMAYFRKFAYGSINTKDWKDYLYEYFSNKKGLLDGVDWHSWFGDIYFTPNLPHLYQMSSLWEHKSFSIVRKWIYWDNRDHNVPPLVTADDRKLCYVQKIMLLNDLHSYYLFMTIEKLVRIYGHFFRGTLMTGQMRFDGLPKLHKL